MTRINCVPPSELTGKHLVAEYRELPRIFALVGAAVERSIELHLEMTNRGYKPSFEPRLRIAFGSIPNIWFGDWIPTPEALAINRVRIMERLGNG